MELDHWRDIHVYLDSDNVNQALAVFKDKLGLVNNPVSFLFGVIEKLEQSNKSSLRLSFLSIFLSVFPNQPHAVFKAGQVLLQQGSLQDAINVLTSIPESSQLSETSLLLAEAFNACGDLASANTYYRNALQLLDDEQSHCLYANFLQKHLYGEMDQNADFIEALRSIIPLIQTRWPQHQESALAMLADCHTACGEYSESIKILSSIRNRTHEGRESNLAYQYLSARDYEAGFKKASSVNREVVIKEQPAWLQRLPWFKKGLNSDCLVVLSEQGVGDQILHLQFFQSIEELNVDHIIFACEPRIRSLFQRSLDGMLGEGRIQTVNMSDLGAALDSFSGCSVSKAMLSDLVVELGIDGNYKNPLQSYLIPDAELVEQYKSKYRLENTSSVAGISWFSSRNQSYKRKNIALHEWHELLLMPNFNWISIQYGDVRDEVASVNQQLDSKIFIDDLDHVKDIEAAVAQVAAMDLVITVSTACAHMAGALGVRTFVLTPYVPLWYWLNVDDRERSVFYPSVNVLHRSKPNDLSVQFNALKEALSL